MLEYEIGPIRPPSQSQSLLLRATRGCSWNKCFFCGIYKGMRYSVRPADDVVDDVKKAADFYGERRHLFQTCFLQDGDALKLPTGDLSTILRAVKEYFPSIRSVTSYARADTIVQKSVAELTDLREAGLNHLYSGMETGSGVVLRKINKGFSPEDIVRSGLMCKQAGIVLSELLVIGLGGRELWEENALQSAAVLNEISPEFIRVHAAAIKENTKLGHDLAKGNFALQSEEEIVIEQRLLIEKLEGIDSYYMNEHGVNLLLEVRGKLPSAKAEMLAVIDRYLGFTDEVRLHYALGRRLGYYHFLTDMEENDLWAMVDGEVKSLENKTPPVDFTVLCNQLRSQMI